MHPNKVYPLTRGQRMLVSIFKGSSPPTKPLKRVYQLAENFNLSAFTQALQQVVITHPALRLQIVHEGDKWAQTFPLRLPEITETNIKGVSRLHRSIQSKMLIDEEGKQAFDLRKDSPVKAAIFGLNKGFLLCLCVDHIAVDGLAYNLLEKLLSEAYARVLEGGSVLVASDDSLLRYIEKETADLPLEKENLAWWKEYLQGVKLPGKAGSKQKKGGFLAYRIDEGAYSALNEFCKKHRCFIFNVLVAIHLLLLRQAGDKEEQVLAIYASNRSTAEEQTIIGNLYQPLFLRFAIIPDESIVAFIRRIRDQILDAMSHIQVDHLSVCRWLTREAKKQDRDGFSINRSCNMLVIRDPSIFPNALFVERLDNQHRKEHPVVEGAFDIQAFQTPSSLTMEISWDMGAWPLSNEAMAAEAGKLIASIAASI